MSSGNPYASPAQPVSEGRTARSPRPPFIWSAIVLLVGGFFLLLLDGQVFRNACIFLGGLIASTAFWCVFFIRDQQRRYRRLASYVLFGHIVLAIVIVANLPAQYRRQRQFNAALKRVVDEMRQRSNGPAR